MTRIFISYRRDDAGYVASIVRDHLEGEFGADSVFMDIDSIPLGVDFRQHLSDAVAGCDMLLALIGETWAGPAGSGPPRRIDDPKDFVRIEIEAALRRGIPVVPVLIDKALPPAADTLPESLRELAFRNAAELRAGRDLDSHLQNLTRGLRAHLHAQRAAAADTAPITSSRTSPDTPPPTSPPTAGRRGGIGIGLAAALAVLVTLGGWGLMSRPGVDGPDAKSERRAQATTGTSAPPSAAPRSPAAMATTKSPAAPTLPDAAPPAAPPAAVPTPAPTTPLATAPAAPAPQDAAQPRSADPGILDGFTIAIYYPSGDTSAATTARALRAELARRGIQRNVELRLATAKSERDAVRGDAFELRYDAEIEAAHAKTLEAALAAFTARRGLRLVPAGKRTPQFLSIFVPAGG